MSKKENKMLLNHVFDVLYLLQKISKILNLNVILDQKLNFMCH